MGKQKNLGPRHVLMDCSFSLNESIVERMKRLGDSYPKALVTGGTSGLGLAFCNMLLEEGVEVTTLARRSVQSSCANDLYSVQLDLCDSSAVAAFADEHLSNQGVPDLLINNAGYGAFFEWGEFPDEEISRQVEVLFTAPVRLCRAFAPAMKERGSGGIVNVTSIAGLLPLPYMPLYNGAKAALSAFSASLSLEYNGMPFVNDFRLGDFRTDFNVSVKKMKAIPSNSSACRAWEQIEKQLNSSPEPIAAAKTLRRVLSEKQDGITYAGGFLQARLAPLLYRLAPVGILRTILRRWYRL